MILVTIEPLRFSFRLDYSYERTIFSVVFGITIWFQIGTLNNAMHIQFAGDY